MAKAELEYKKKQNEKHEKQEYSRAKSRASSYSNQ